MHTGVSFHNTSIIACVSAISEWAQLNIILRIFVKIISAKFCKRPICKILSL